ncbi:hypothetical protein [Arthrobacter sp. zg-Y1110]|uniref:hypothetical protein n=1 Tax=Arthrobacter sp. zg-Y1110 TaxID=2886932 RepID=UPI001D1350AE|nr:hypothetical protein [Arthrobacter sp. zg-Y1110]MCC3291647.1 hypothetical protein [Arthrobacter sp. zg-Y1110]UWX85490.1 hypothetical protein N2K99_02725 [Arthrobacter sp. zg-Y1110]
MTEMYVPTREPSLEEVASRLAGVPLERLSGLRAKQPFASDGPWLDPAAASMLHRVAQNGRIGRLERSGNGPSIKVLADAGLLDSAGRLTPGGRVITRPLDQPAAVLHFRASSLGQATELQVWLDGTNALMLAGPSAGVLASPSEKPADTAGKLQLKFVSLHELFPVLAAWLGISPAWNLPVSPAAFPVEILNERHRDSGAPLPEGADEALAYAWSQPWFLWHLVMDPATGEGVGYLNAGGAGHYRVVADEDQATLASIPSANVYRHLVDLVESVRFQRPPRFA